MKPRSRVVRLPRALAARLEAYAKANGITFAAAGRLLVVRGAAEIERAIRDKKTPR